MLSEYVQESMSCSAHFMYSILSVSYNHEEFWYSCPLCVGARSMVWYVFAVESWRKCASLYCLWLCALEDYGLLEYDYSIHILFCFIALTSSYLSLDFALHFWCVLHVPGFDTWIEPTLLFNWNQLSEEWVRRKDAPKSSQEEVDRWADTSTLWPTWQNKWSYCAGRILGLGMMVQLKLWFWLLFVYLNKTTISVETSLILIFVVYWLPLSVSVSKSWCLAIELSVPEVCEETTMILADFFVTQMWWFFCRRCWS